MQQERSLILIKPDGVQRRLIGEIIGRFERAGLKLTAMKLVIPTAEQATEHYPSTKEWFTNVGKKFFKEELARGEEVAEEKFIEAAQKVKDGLVKFLTAGPIVAMIWQGNHSVAVCRKLIGGTEPTTSDVGTIRGDFTIDSYSLANNDGRAVRNLVHGSESPAEAERELQVWFDKNDVCNYKVVDEVLLTDVSLDGIKE
ncbi:MAG TPA: nucleoside-diphosphate kinase [bacterium]|nr:nucleoside-diphosphate kinase [bacterium]